MDILYRLQVLAFQSSLQWPISVIVFIHDSDQIGVLFCYLPNSKVLITTEFYVRLFCCYAECKNCGNLISEEEWNNNMDLKYNFEAKIIGEMETEAALMMSINICSQCLVFRAWFSIKISDNQETNWGCNSICFITLKCFIQGNHSTVKNVIERLI